jgi:hypothetical protein
MYDIYSMDDNIEIIRIEKPKHEIVALDNPDKNFHEKWTADRHLANIPHPYRCVMIGKPNSGKGVVLQQLILHADPPFENIKVWHCSPEQTHEFDDVVVNPEEDIVGDIPPLSSWDPDVKNLLIIDDVNLAGLSKEDKKIFDRTCGFTSTHCNLSICILVQDLLQVKPNIRRMMNVICLWKLPDTDAMAVLARRCGVKRKYFMQLMRKFKSYHDFLMIDGTNASPAPLRLNLYSRVILPEEDK